MLELAKDIKEKQYTVVM